MDDKYLTPLEAIESARQITPIYMGGSRQMHILSGDQEYINRNKQYDANPSLGFDLFAEQHVVLIPITEETDHDFYATYSPALADFLFDHGFEQTDFVKGMDTDGGSYTLDEEAVTILERENVQIVLRKDAELYKAVFDNIDPLFYKKYLWKSSGAQTLDRENIQPIFNMLFDIARAAKGLK